MVPAVDVNQIQIDLYSLARTIPQKNTKTDFDYGDKFEILALTSLQLESLKSVCHENFDPKCYSSDFGLGSFNPISWSWVFLQSYGLAGYVSVSYVDQNTGKSKQKEILGSDDGRLKFCGAFSADISADTYVGSLTTLQDATADRESRRILDSDHQHKLLFGQQDSEPARDMKVRIKRTEVGTATLKAWKVSSFLVSYKILFISTCIVLKMLMPQQFTSLQHQIFPHFFSLILRLSLAGAEPTQFPSVPPPWSF